MLWIIIGLVAIGLTLIVIELVFVPGTTVVGILGAVFAILGIVFCYRHFGSEIGFYTMMGTLVTMLAALVYSLRSGAWSKFSLKTAIDSRVNEGLMTALSAGEEGVTVSTLRPIGKADFNGKHFEVKTVGDYVEPGIRIRIREINANQIIVEPIN